MEKYKRFNNKIKYYLKEIKANAKVFYDEEAYDREFGHFRFSDILFCVTIIVITPLTIISFAFSGESLLYVCCFFWVCVLYYILAILFRNL